MYTCMYVYAHTHLFCMHAYHYPARLGSSEANIPPPTDPAGFQHLNRFYAEALLDQDLVMPWLFSRLLLC